MKFKLLVLKALNNLYDKDVTAYKQRCEEAKQRQEAHDEKKRREGPFFSDRDCDEKEQERRERRDRGFLDPNAGFGSF